LSNFDNLKTFKIKTFGGSEMKKKIAILILAVSLILGSGGFLVYKVVTKYGISGWVIFAWLIVISLIIAIIIISLLFVRKIKNLLCWPKKHKFWTAFAIFCFVFLATSFLQECGIIR
jgi:hypothetical protein